MILITEHAEEKLYKALYSAWEKKSGQRCMQISKSPGEESELPIVMKAVSEAVEDQEGMIFDCMDGDIYILASGMTIKTQDRINTVMRGSTPGASPAPAPGPANLFDIQMHWASLIGEVDRKREMISAREGEKRKQEEKEKQEQLRRLIIGIHFDDTAIDGMYKKRDTRQKIGIMIVEDDSFTRSLLFNTLKNNHEALPIADGYNAIVKYPIHAPDIVFLDIDLPDINGLELLAKIKSFDPAAHIVMLSGNSNKTNIMQAIEKGAKGFIGKPFTKEKLFQYINKCPKAIIQNGGIKNEIHI
jgi:two-component system chemotaxis response regulator CheY